MEGEYLAPPYLADSAALPGSPHALLGVELARPSFRRTVT